MRLIYTNENRIMVLNIKNVLMSYDIDVTLNNEFASSASGGLAPFDTWPEVWLLKDNDYDKAKKIIDSISLESNFCLLYTSPSPRDLSTSRMPSSA